MVILWLLSPSSKMSLWLLYITLGILVSGLLDTMHGDEGIYGPELRSVHRLEASFEKKKTVYS